jgi:hypothetical protein
MCPQFFGGGSGEVVESFDLDEGGASPAAVGTVGSGGGGYGFCQRWMLNFVISIFLFGPFSICFLALFVLDLIRATARQIYGSIHLQS